ncbi:MAG: hypothetical protein ABR536_00090 [Solirubrobacterales bacterium]
MLDERQHDKYQAGAEGIIEPGEQVEAAAWGWESQPSTASVVAAGIFGLLRAPAQLQKGRIVLVTPANVYLAKAKPFSAYKCAELIDKTPRAGVSSSFTGDDLLVGDHKVEIGPNPRYRRAAESVVEALGDP